eukprot:11246213-Prorocentrum_lima.AAC.1
MTSSLVGSEMCIRDRYCNCSSDGAWHATPVVGPGAEVCVAASSSQSEIPVSYTHLTLPTICSV